MKQNKTNVTLVLDKDVYKKFSEACKMQGVIKSFVIENLIKEHLKKTGCM